MSKEAQQVSSAGTTVRTNVHVRLSAHKSTVEMQIYAVLSVSEGTQPDTLFRCKSKVQAVSPPALPVCLPAGPPAPIHLLANTGFALKNVSLTS